MILILRKIFLLHYLCDNVFNSDNSNRQNSTRFQTRDEIMIERKNKILQLINIKKFFKLLKFFYNFKSKILQTRNLFFQFCNYNFSSLHVHCFFKFRNSNKYVRFCFIHVLFFVIHILFHIYY